MIGWFWFPTHLAFQVTPVYGFCSISNLLKIQIKKTSIMKLQTAARKRAKIKMALQGPSGSGKTFSSLLIAYGLTSNWEKIAVVDTENHSADLYAYLGPFMVIAFVE